MSTSALYRDPVLLLTDEHAKKKIKPLSDYSVAKAMHAVFLTLPEFGFAALEFPIIFVNTASPDAAKPALSPVALLGLVPGENLMVNDTQWNGRYIPAFIRRYPFLSGHIEGVEDVKVFIDAAWDGFSDTEGEALFNDKGEPTQTLTNAIDFMQQFDTEADRTRLFCQQLFELDILQPMKADATMPNGETLSLDGFFTVDEEKFAKLPDAKVLEMHRNGMLPLLQTHIVSLGNLGKLVERKAARVAETSAA